MYLDGTEHGGQKGGHWTTVTVSFPLGAVLCAFLSRGIQEVAEQIPFIVIQACGECLDSLGESFNLRSSA